MKRATAREHFVQDDTERPDVRAAVHGLAARLLGRHVGGRADDHAHGGHGGRGHGGRQTSVLGARC